MDAISLLAAFALLQLDITPETLAKDWVVTEGEWAVVDGVLEQTNAGGTGFAFLPGEVRSDLEFSAEFQPVDDGGDGVRAAILTCRSTDSLTFYWAHFDSKNRQVILVKSSPAAVWTEIGRKGGVSIPAGEWSKGGVRCIGTKLEILLNDDVLLEAEDEALAAGCVGLGTSQGHVKFRNVELRGKPAEIQEGWHIVKPSHVMVCKDAGAGGYEAFPDVVRLQNGDLLCVMYAGYGHVSMPNDQLPKGGRICAVRSTDDGETWGEATVVFDDDIDNRDPHIAQLSDGTLICSFFSLFPEGERWGNGGTHIIRSDDGGSTWETETTLISDTYYCSAPVREMADGTLILGLYSEGGGSAWGAVTRSTDGGKTWSTPIDIGKESGHRHDAETDVIELKNGDLLAVMRPCMCYATSPDLGLTWSDSAPMGFEGHAAYLFRHSSGTILVAHRLPATSLHYTFDEAKTWHGPVKIDDCGGAYPSMCELPDGRVFIVYYEEGGGSSIRGKWLKVTDESVEVLTRE